MYLEREAITLEEAKSRLREINIKQRTKKQLVAQSLGYYLAETIYAPFDYPSFRRSGYDGYGICSADDQEYPKKVKLVSHIPAGDVYASELQKGEAVRIMTGAAVPKDVAKVIMLENTKLLSDDEVMIYESSKFDNITPIGAEFTCGDMLLEKGMQLNAGALSLLSAFGITACVVYEKAQVGILTTGSEVVEPGETASYGTIFNSNGLLLEGMVAENHGHLVERVHLQDDFPALIKKLDELVQTCDVIITSGGVSVGDFDFMAVAAKQEGELLFNKIKMRPGSPTTAFIYQETLVIALSGNPGACFTGFYLFVEPLLQQMRGGISGVRGTRMRLAEDYQKLNSFDRYLRGIYFMEAGEQRVALVGSDKSSALGNLHLTTCLVKIPRETKQLAGMEVEVLCLPYR